MISPLDPNSQLFLADLKRIGDRMTQANEQMSSGLKVSVASDAPGSVADILDFQAAIQRSQQIQTNLTRLKSETDTADSVLQNAVKLVDRARTLATMGATSTNGAQTRDAMATEVAGILQSMVALSNTSASGRFIFGGDNDMTQPYKYDESLIDPAVPQIDPIDRTSAPPPSTRMIEQPDGTTFAPARSAREIFDGAPASVFHALSELLDQLRNGTPDGVAAIVPDLRAASDHLNSQLTFYGTVSNTIDNAIGAANRQETQLKASLSPVRDADIAEAAVNLQQATLNQQAALGTFSSTPRKSLFDYLG